jgi:trk system potassium uptake protein TrkH
LAGYFYVPRGNAADQCHPGYFSDQALIGLDWTTALSGAATATCNVGPGLGMIIGPAGDFSSLPDAAKWLLTIGMLLGRLEILTVRILITPVFWRY